MAILTIYRDTRAPGRCRSCGAAIEWAELTVSRKRTPFDRIAPMRTQSTLSIADEQRAIDVLDTTTSPTHFETCPDANEWRRSDR